MMDEFEKMKSFYDETLLSIGNCDLLNIEDKTALFHLRTFHNLKEFLQKVNGAIETEQ